MPTIHTEVEIAAPPSEVRSVFLDNSKYPEWSTSFIKSIEPRNGGGLEAVKPGDKLTVVLTGATFKPTVLDNNESLFKWSGSLPGVFTGDHRFEFQPSTSTPGGTRLVQAEDFSGMLSFLVGPTWKWGKSTKTGFEAFNEEIKARAEEMKTESQS